MTKNDAKFIRAGRTILGWSQAEFASMLKVTLADVNALETMAESANGALCETAFRALLDRGVANPALLRSARGLIGETQEELAGNAEIAPGTYRRLEKIQVDADAIIRSSGSLAKLLIYLLSKGVFMNFDQRTGAGVSLKGLLQMPELRGLNTVPHAHSKPKWIRSKNPLDNPKSTP